MANAKDGHNWLTLVLKE